MSEPSSPFFWDESAMRVEIVAQVIAAIEAERAKEPKGTTQIDQAYDDGLSDAAELARRVGAGES